MNINLETNLGKNLKRGLMTAVAFSSLALAGCSSESSPPVPASPTKVMCPEVNPGLLLPITPAGRTVSEMDEKGHEIMKVVFSSGLNRPQVGEGYFISSPKDLSSSYGSEGHIQSKQNNFFSEVHLSRENSLDPKKYFVTINLGLLKKDKVGLGSQTSSVIINPCSYHLIKFKWNDWRIYGAMLDERAPLFPE